MKPTRRHKTLGAFAAACFAGAAALAFTVPALADSDTTIHINQGNVPTTAADFKNSCDQIPAGTAKWLDGWVFVLPGAVGADGNFKRVDAVFEDAEGNELRFDTGSDGGIVSGSGNNKAYIITPAGLTLVDATAQVKLKDNGKDKGKGNKDKFNLTHACPATENPPAEETPSDDPSSPGEDPSSPVDEPSSPGEDPSSPVDEPSSPTDEESSPGEETTSPGDDPSSTEGESESASAPGSSNPAEEPTSKAGSALPVTGSPLALVLAVSGALLAAGVVLLLFMRRGRETAEH
ncbi:hypothetical protein AB0B28_04090 [Glycomyces sp. NPDC046736]|uniref:hypothetical protein n=1 Tax=Glycomyces sp. NPDC046736 TaxID=3155615 RepID=UPI0033F2C89E